MIKGNSRFQLWLLEAWRWDSAFPSNGELHYLLSCVCWLYNCNLPEMIVEDSICKVYLLRWPYWHGWQGLPLCYKIFLSCRMGWRCDGNAIRGSCSSSGESRPLCSFLFSFFYPPLGHNAFYFWKFMTWTLHFQDLGTFMWTKLFMLLPNVDISNHLIYLNGFAVLSRLCLWPKWFSCLGDPAELDFSVWDWSS